MLVFFLVFHRKQRRARISLEDRGIEREFSDLGFFKLDFTVDGLQLSRSCPIPLRLYLASAFIGRAWIWFSASLLHYLI